MRVPSFLVENVIFSSRAFPPAKPLMLVSCALESVADVKWMTTSMSNKRKTGAT
jgi:hypothetical protein